MRGTRARQIRKMLEKNKNIKPENFRRVYQTIKRMYTRGKMLVLK